MKKIIQRTVLAALSTFMVSESFAERSVNAYELSYKCELVARQLLSDASNKPSAPCSGEVGVAGAYLDASASQIEKGRYREAKDSLQMAQSELQNIAYSGQRCENFSLVAQRSLIKVILIGADLDYLDKERRLEKP